MLPIVEEELQVGERRFDTERVRVRTSTDCVPIDLLIEQGADLLRFRTGGNVTILRRVHRRDQRARENNIPRRAAALCFR